MAFLSDDEIERLLERLEVDARRVAILCLSTGRGGVRRRNYAGSISSVIA